MRPSPLYTDLIPASILVLVGGYFWWLTWEMPRQAAYYPRLLLVLFILLSGALAVKGWLERARSRELLNEDNENPKVSQAEAESEKVSMWQGPLVILALIVLYLIALPRLHYVPASALFLVVSMLVMGVRNIAHLVLVPAGAIFILYYSFGRLLMVPLP